MQKIYATMRLYVLPLDGLRSAGYQIPPVGQVDRMYNMPGGGYEIQFPYQIPPQFLGVPSK